ncbi:MAG TPA: glycosyltransferase family 39 protein, partial [Anaerolineae bacterium]
MSRSASTLVSRFAAQARRWRFLGLIVLLGSFFVQAIAASPYNSVTFDEQYHVTPGYVYLKTGDLRFHHDQNPPLFEAIISLPLLLRADLNLPLDHPAYALWGDVYLFSDDFLWHANPDAQGIVHTGRLVVAGFGVLLGLLLFVWGKQLYGERAGWVAAFLLAFDPNFIANAIPTLDLGLAFTSTLAMWRLWHYLKRPTQLNVALAGLALGFALATKFLSVMLLPSFVLGLLIYPISRNTQHASSWIGRLVSFAIMLLLADLVLWITYRFQFGPVGGAGLSIPAPQYFESFIGMFLKSSEGRANFLMGQTSVAGWPYYFVIALLIKTPLPTLLFILAALIRWPHRREWRESSLLILPALFFFGSASISQLQLGYRYLLPVLPFLFLMAGRAGQDVSLFHRSRWTKIAAVGLAAWLVIGTVSIFPHYLSYFNESIGGPANGYKYLVDSNVDWGQDLPALKDWMDTHPANDLRLGFFGSAYPDRYGIQAIGLPSYPLNAGGNEVNGFTSYSLEPGRYALSATLLRIGLVSKQFNLYAAFQSMTPIDRVGYSILIYDVKYPPGAETDRAVISGLPSSEVPPEALGYRPDHPLRAKWCAFPECFVLTPHPARYIVPDTIPFSTIMTTPAQQQAKLIQMLSLPN